MAKSGIDFHTYDSSLQEGDTFGDRITNAFQYGFDLGYQRIIIVGNDTLSLQVEHLHRARRQLEDHDIVVGPSRDGGVYLLGLSRQTFDAHRMKQLPWKTGHLYAALADYHDISSSVFHLEKLDDFDQTSHDLVLLNELIQAGVSQRILDLIFKTLCLPLVQLYFSFFGLTKKLHLSLRGPPRFA